MTKAELLEKIDEGIRTEESAITIYARHLEALIQMRRMPPDVAKSADETLHFLMRTNVAHKRALETVRARVVEDPANDL